MPVRTAQVVFAGDAQSVVRAAREARDAVAQSATSIEAADKRMAASAAAAADSAQKSAAVWGASAARQAQAAGEAAAKTTAAAGASADAQVAAYKKAADAANIASARHTTAGAGFIKAGKDIAVGAAVAAAGALDMGLKMEHAAGRIAAASGSSVSDAKKIEKAFEGTSGTAIVNAAKIGEAYANVAGELASVRGHALNSAEAMQVMNAAMALMEASGESLAASTEALGKVMLVYHLNAGKAAEASDILFAASKKTGTALPAVAEALERIRGRLGALAPSLKESGGLMAELSSHGIKGRESLAALSGMFNTMLGGSKKVEETLKLLNIHLFDSHGKFIGLKGVIAELQPVFAKYDQQSQLNIAHTLFGASANKKLLDIIHEGPGAYQRATDAVSKHGSAEEAAKKHSETFAGQLEKARAALEDLAGNIGQKIMPAFKVFVEGLKDAVSWLGKHEGAAKVLAGVITTVLGAAVAAFAFSTGRKFVNTLMDMVGAARALAVRMGLTAGAVVTADAGMVTANEGAAASFTTMSATAVGALAKIGLAAGGVVLAIKGIESALGAITGESQSVTELLGGNQPGEKNKEQQGSRFQKFNKEFGTKAYREKQTVSEVAKRFGIDPNVLWGVYGTETSYGKNIGTSSTGAVGAFQFEPETAKAYGYPMTNHPNAQQFQAQAEAAARYLQVLKREHGGSIQEALAYYSGHTPGYAQKVQSNYGTETFNLPGKAKKGAKPANLESQIDKWAEASVGKFAESWGQNMGPELNKLQKEFHTTAAAWCAEFATTAAMMGGANKAVRTASVATIREWAQQGSHGYQKGISSTPHVGSLMLFGDQHVGFVQSVDKKAGTVTTIEGNTGAGKVARETHKIAGGEFAMPLYGKLGGGKGELAETAKGFANAIKEAEHLILTPLQKFTVMLLSAKVAGTRAQVGRLQGAAAEHVQDLQTYAPLWAAKRQPLSTKQGAWEQGAIDFQQISTAQVDKKLYEKELVYLRKEAQEWAKLRDSYQKFARHQQDPKAKLEALKKAGQYQVKVEQAQQAAKAMGATIIATEAAILEAQKQQAALPGEVQEADLGSYQSRNQQIDNEFRAGHLTEAQGKAAKEANAQKALAGGYGPLSAEGKLGVEGDLREFQKAVESATSAIEAERNAREENTKKLLEETQQRAALAEAENSVLAKIIGDMANGQIGAVNYHARQLSPGSGSAASY